jgi:hypothetical protein
VSYDRAVELAEKIQAAGVPATVDPRSATPPCVLVTPPGRTYDLGCGYTAAWQLLALAPGPGNADSWKVLDDLEAAVAGVVDVRSSIFLSYTLGDHIHPAKRIEYEEAISWP